MADNPATNEQALVLDNVSYNVSDLPETAVNQLGNVRVCEAKLVQLQQEVGMVRTARAAYVEALKKLVENVPGTPVEPAGDTPAVNVEEVAEDAGEAADAE